MILGRYRTTPPEFHNAREEGATTTKQAEPRCAPGAGLTAGLLGAFVIGAFVTGCGRSPSSAVPIRPVSPGTSPAGAGFRLALPGYRYSFPTDAGSHPPYASEWWYYTGHLDGPSGRIGFELTFFRVGLSPHRAARASRWATHDLILAHYALSDMEGRRFQFADRLDRGSLGVSGARIGSEDVWLEDWRALQGPSVGKPPALWTHHLQAAAGFGAIDLELTPLKPPVIHGIEGISRKGPAVGEASHYYSYTRLQVRGWLRVHGATEPVSGLAWMDHEFGSSQLSSDETGWDWHSVQLDDGWDLMLYRMRRKEGDSPFSSGTLVAPDGRSSFLDVRSFEIKAMGTWRSSASGATYPSGWKIRIPRASLDLTLAPDLADQELRTEGTSGVDYWEGATHAAGVHSGRSVSGQGYTELTGYGTALTQLH